jgi:hypothetical protein
MKTILFVASLCWIGSAATAQSASTIATPVSVHYTHSELTSLIKNAKTPAEYSALRDYYGHVAELDRAKAAQEKQEWDLRKAYPPRKFPSPVDSAHNLYDSYVYEANAASTKADHYDQLAKNSTAHEVRN